MKAASDKWDGKTLAWTRKQRDRADSGSGLFRRRNEDNDMTREQTSARKSDGESPANQTKKATAEREIASAKRRVARFLPRKAASPPKRETCMPESAITWLSPAFLKASDTAASVQSREPESKARRKPPASPHECIRCRNDSLQTARKRSMEARSPRPPGRGSTADTKKPPPARSETETRSLDPSSTKAPQESPAAVPIFPGKSDSTISQGMKRTATPAADEDALSEDARSTQKSAR